jgi:predicted site-specific integrase-resolvase
MSLRVKAHEAAAYYGISISNLRKWGREGAIPTERTPKGHFIYIIPECCKRSEFTTPDEWSDSIIYARVSSKKQKGDLLHQVQALQSKFPEYTLLEDIGSGFNYERKNFRSLLERLFQGKIRRVVVSHQDRFCRFGFDFFQWLFQQFGATLESMEHPNPEKGEDMVADIMEVFTVFTARYYGRRKYHPNFETQDIPKFSPEKTDE